MAKDLSENMLCVPFAQRIHFYAIEIVLKAGLLCCQFSLCIDLLSAKARNTFRKRGLRLPNSPRCRRCIDAARVLWQLPYLSTSKWIRMANSFGTLVYHEPVPAQLRFRWQDWLALHCWSRYVCLSYSWPSWSFNFLSLVCRFALSASSLSTLLSVIQTFLDLLQLLISYLVEMGAEVAEPGRCEFRCEWLHLVPQLNGCGPHSSNWYTIFRCS